MEIKVLSATEKPIDIISLAAGTSYRKNNVSYKRVENCVKNRHTSVLEHANITFLIEDISRSCSHQLVRHRLASFVQQSQRYCKYDLNNNDWYIIPPDMAKDTKRLQLFQSTMNYAGQTYMKMLEEGVKAEDARYVLPEAMKTSITMTMNVREFFSLLNLRLSPKAQWEIREMAKMEYQRAKEYNEQWRQVMELYDKVQDLIL